MKAKIPPLFKAATAPLAGALVVLLVGTTGCQTPSDDTADVPDFSATVESGQPSDEDAARSADAPPRDESVGRRAEHNWEPAIPQGEREIPASEDSGSNSDDSEAPPTASLSAAEVTDGDLEAFAAAYTDIVDLKHRLETEYRQASTSRDAAELRDRLQQRSLELVDQQGLSPEEFNAISELLDEHEDLRDRAQAAIDSLDR